MVKLCDTIDQTNSDEVPVMTEALHMAAVERYINRMGAEPVEDVEPSLEQYTSIVHLLTLGAPPYADFSVWVPTLSATKSG
jgi:hypothetical protein